MSSQMLSWLIAGALFVHGVGHLLGFWMPVRCWLLPGASEKMRRAISSVFWIVSLVGFVAASLSFLGILLPGDLWQGLAVVSACVSLLGLVLFIGNWPVFNTAGALGMNIAVLVTQLWLGWPA